MGIPDDPFHISFKSIAYVSLEHCEVKRFSQVYQQTFRHLPSRVHRLSMPIKASGRRQTDRANTFDNYITFTLSQIHLTENRLNFGWFKSGIDMERCKNIFCLPWLIAVTYMVLQVFCISLCGKELGCLLTFVGTSEQLQFCAKRAKACSNSLKSVPSLQI